LVDRKLVDRKLVDEEKLAQKEKLSEKQETAHGQTKPKVAKLNWGCGGYPAGGWINADLYPYPGLQIVGDILEGLPLATNSISYAVSIHALPEIAYPDLIPALQELRRVLEPSGVLRLCLPDIEKGIAAYRAQDLDYFAVPDEDARSIGGKFITQTVWYGFTRTPFTEDFIEELLLKAEFTRVDRCSYMQTASPFPDIVELDNREHESLYVEAVK
jgi:predicted SAM-dependent methyltransferase